MRTMAPCGLRHTPSPDGLKPRVTSSPSWSGIVSGGGFAAGQTTGFSLELPGWGSTRRFGFFSLACSSDSRSSSEPSSWAKKAPEMRAWSFERRMQFAQSGSESKAAYEPSPSVWPHRVVTGPERGTLGVRWIRPPDLRRTDSSLIVCTPKSWRCQAASCLSALFGLRVGDARRPSLAHALLLEGFIRLGLLDRRSVLLTG